MVLPVPVTYKPCYMAMLVNLYCADYMKNLLKCRFNLLYLEWAREFLFLKSFLEMMSDVHVWVDTLSNNVVRDTSSKQTFFP